MSLKLYVAIMLLAAATTATPAAPAEPHAAANSVTVTLHHDGQAAPIPDDFIGFSYEKAVLSQRLFDPENTALIALFKRLGPGIVRIAGATVDRSQWDGTGNGLTPKTISPPDLDRLAAFLNACGWKAIYGVNLVTNTPARAAAEAACAAAKLKDRLYGFEIGNEPNLYNRGSRPKQYGYAQFLGEWTAYAKAISTAVPDAVLTGPSSSTYGLKNYTLPMAKDARNRLALLTSHYYTTGSKDENATMEFMLAFPDRHLEEVLESMKKAAAENQIRLGFRLDEANSFHTSGKRGVSDTLGSALWTVNVLFTCAEHGCGGVNFHTGGHAAYTPIIHNKGAPVIDKIMPEFYGIQLFALASSGVPLQLEVAGDTGVPALAAHAVVGKGGATYIALINTNATKACDATIRFNSDMRTAECIALTGPSLNSKDGIQLGGVAINTDGTWNPKWTAPMVVPDRCLSLAIAPASVLLVKASR